jgi:hypothetical protein
MSISKHTALPWEYRRDEEEDRHYIATGVFCIVHDVHGTRITNNRGQEEREANARFIVRAVNSHDELLAALKELRCWIGQGKSAVTAGAKCECLSDALEKADAAIREAEARDD